VLGGYGEYMTAAGPVKALRHCYGATGTNGASFCPIELRAGIVEGFFAPLAVRNGRASCASRSRPPRRPCLPYRWTERWRKPGRMEYARLRTQNLPNGAVEAAGKTLVTQRKKRSSQRWSIDGGKAFLTSPALA